MRIVETRYTKEMDLEGQAESAKKAVVDAVVGLELDPETLLYAAFNVTHLETVKGTGHFSTKHATECSEHHAQRNLINAFGLEGEGGSLVTIVRTGIERYALSGFRNMCRGDSGKFGILAYDMEKIHQLRPPQYGPGTRLRPDGVFPEAAIILNRVFPYQLQGTGVDAYPDVF